MAAQQVYGVPESGAHPAMQSTTGPADPKTVVGPRASNGAPKYTAMLIAALTSAVMVTFDGSAPTATNGMLVAPGVPVLVPVNSLNDPKFCGQSAAASCSITFVN